MNMPEEFEIIIDQTEEEPVFSPPAGFVPSGGDIEIFRLINEYRFLRREHISALTGQPLNGLHRRLFKLVVNGYLTSIRLPRRKHIYALGREALPILVEQGAAT